MQKITIDTGAVCPNRDGTLGHGGCIYCSNDAFSPGRHRGESVTAQIEQGKAFFARKYPAMRYLAYFQSHTATHAAAGTFMSQVLEAAEVRDVAGIIVGTRPDCMPRELLDMLSDFNRRNMPLMIEYGMETSSNSTLARINRCHTHECTVDAVERTHKAGIDCGVHLIFGLPGEDRSVMLESVDAVNRLPVSFVKFHQMQIVCGTALARSVAEGREAAHCFNLDDYIDFCCTVIGKLRHDIAIDRFTAQCPASMLIAPKWGIKNYEFTAKLHRRLRELSSSRM